MGSRIRGRCSCLPGANPDNAAIARRDQHSAAAYSSIYKQLHGAPGISATYPWLLAERVGWAIKSPHLLSASKYGKMLGM
jgi:hypothetical protein